MPINKQIIEVSTRTMVKLVLFGLGLLFLYLVRDVVIVLLLSIVIASGIEPGIRYMNKIFRFPRVFAVLLIYIAVISLFVLVFYLLIPPMINELQNFALTFPVSLEGVLDELRVQAYESTHFAPGSLIPSSEELTRGLNRFINEQAFGFFSIGSSIFGGALSLVIVVVLSFYLAVQEDGISNFLKIVTPREHEPYVLDLWTRSQQKIGRWLQGQFILAVLVGVLVYLGLVFLEVKYALILAILAGLFEIIPVFGPIMAAIPSVAIAFVQAPSLGLWVVALYTAVQQVENHLIYPLVVRRAVGVPPLLVIISLLVGGELGGFFGFILAVPIAAAIVEYVNDVAATKQVLENA